MLVDVYDDEFDGQLHSILSNVSTGSQASYDLSRYGHVQEHNAELHAVPAYVWCAIVAVGLAVIVTIGCMLVEEKQAGLDNVAVPVKDGSSRFRMLMLVRAVTAGTSIGEGYAIGCVSLAIVLIRKELSLSTTQSGCFLGVTYFFIAIGAPLGGWFADHIGRKPLIAASYIFITIGSLMMAFTASFMLLFVGRMVESVGFGIGLSVVTTYLAEVAPAIHRGHFASLEQPFLLFGAVVGNVNGILLLGAPNSWRWLVGIGAIVPTIMVFCISALPESPRFLALHDQKEEAKIVLADFVDELEAEEFLKCQSLARESPAKWSEVLWPQDVAKRWAVVASVGIMWLQKLSGVTVFGMHLPMLLNKIMGTTAAFEVSLGLMIVRIGAAFIGSLVVDDLGRRPLLISSSLGVAFSLVLLGFAWCLDWRISTKISILFFYLTFFEVGLGPVAWVYPGEALNTKLRSKGTAIALLCSRMLAGFLIVLVPVLSDCFGGEGISFMILAALNACGTVFIIFCVPETKGTQLEAIETDVFINRHVNRRQTTGNAPEVSVRNTRHRATL